MGAWSTMGGPYSTAWFTEPDQTAGVERMKAVVVQRVAAERTNGRANLLATLQRVRRKRFSIRPDLPTRMLAPEWSGSVGEEGPGQILYSRERALVRVRGADYAVPNDNRALIVLVDQTAQDVLASIKTQTVLAPTAPRAPFYPTVDQGERKRLRMEQIRNTSAIWHAWLENEPFIRAFVAEKGGA